MDAVPAWTWLVTPATVAAGEISLEANSLVLRDGDRVTARIPMREVMAVRRLRGTPVIQVERRRDSGDEVLLIYFAEPPGVGSWERESMGAPRGGLERTAGMLRLRWENREKKPLVMAWERAIRELAAG